MSQPSKKRRPNEEDGVDDKEELIKQLQEKVAALEAQVQVQDDNSANYYCSSIAAECDDDFDFPLHGIAARHIAERLEQSRQLDFSPRLNTSSYVNVVSEPEERQVALLGAEVNLADGSVYPASVRVHDKVVNVIAKMWHAPPPHNGNYCGAGTVGSTEACLLAGLALKFRWRRWYAKKHGIEPDSEALMAVRPNLVISTCYQAAWEKFFRYFEVTAKFAKPQLVANADGSSRSMSVNPKDLAELCDEKTIGVVAILGNHYNGVYDPVWEVDAELSRINKERGLQVGIHVDAASGGFIAPFQDAMKDRPFDFRLQNVLSISTSGHKFGESVCGTGWVVFRQREDLAEHIAVSVTYLGGHSDSMTLNFSRPASGVYVQYYKLMRLGITGYRSKVSNQMKVAKYLRDFLKNQTYEDLENPESEFNGKPRFQILDGGDDCCLPVVAARLNPELKLKYDDIDLQHALSESHWYVSGYTLSFENFCNHGIEESLFTDTKGDSSMFRIVCKSNLTMGLAEDLTEQFNAVIPVLDRLQDGYQSMHTAKATVQAGQAAIRKMQRDSSVKLETASAVALAAQKWLSKAKSAREKVAGYGTKPRRGSLFTTC